MADRHRSPLVRRVLATGGLAALLLAAGAGVASAHVTVSAPGVTAGGSDAVISFQVPDESEAARTVGLKLRLPTDTPIASVLVQPKPGWSVTVRSSKLATPITTDDGQVTEAVSEIDWKVSAGNQGIAPGQFDQFTFIAGQLPDAPSLTFKAVQDYSDGSTVSWIEEAAPGSTAEPEHPAPVLTLAAGSGGKPGTSAPPSATAQAGPPAGAVPASAASDDAASKGTAVTGIVLGALGLLLGLAALAVALRRRGPA
jgi:uncharacterized protein YcnI